ncbi:iron transporter FeoB [Thioclava dalianensis]|uniref:Ferrous iron transport protein B n=1 Tax=Thioclava dalianensis TaxID=1185766 RepID=A0A074U751_9RHOB|nr:ferrous iron transporter B [Thioclava dalianensis]KEP70507.1 iron transporter FeoB [Thioclava dalianensis]SFN08572.1 ferrous iron transport protein B [Thioclava dalianensis]
MTQAASSALPLSTRTDPETQPIEAALVGAPNCGKTALFNALTGATQKVGNYSGVTVERKIGVARTPEGRQFSVIDLPGTHSLRARSPDEEVTRDVLLGRRPDERIPDLILAVADATNLRGALRLVNELKSVGLPIVLVLNMIDIARHRGLQIDHLALSQSLGIPVVTATAVRRGGLDALWEVVAPMLEAPLPAAQPATWVAPNSHDLRVAMREADRLVKAHVIQPAIPDTVTARIDRVVLHPIAGPVILLVLLFTMFQAVFTWATPFMDAIDAGFTWLGTLVAQVIPSGLIQSFLTNGVIAGIGSVIVFLPQILFTFLFILLLEDFGYMARAAFLMDRIMGRAGLNGRAFIPLLSSFACAIPGIMAARVIDNRRDRLTTILVAPLMTCSARIPVYTLIIAAFIPKTKVLGGLSLQGLVMFGLYAVGILSVLVVAFCARFFFARTERSAPLMLDLPDYKMPRARNVALGLYQRARVFLRRAGTVIFWSMVAIWVLSTFPQPPEGATGPAINYSFAAMIGKFIAPILHPLGFNWQIAVALVPGMAAREVAVAGLATVYAVSGDGGLIHTLAGQWSLGTALALLAWYIFAPQCISTLAVIRREAGSGKWMWIALIYMFVLAYVAALITYQIAALLGAG